MLPNKKKKTSEKRKQTGLPPGSIVFTGNRKVDKVVVHYLRYSETMHKEQTLNNHDKIVFPQSPNNEVDWYDLRGLHDTLLIEQLGKAFEIHPLILEDIADIRQRPKYEEYRKGHFLILRAFSFDKELREVHAEQVAIFYRKGLLISFQENETDLFESVRQRVQVGRGRVRQRNSDYLCYALMDAIVDNYFGVLDEIEECIEELEDQILESPEDNIRDRIHQLRKEMLPIRKSIAPLREALGLLSKSDSAFFDESTPVFLRDLYDHTIQVMDMVESYRDMLNGLQDLHLSEISFKMNQVIQVLTIITTIFVPLSFLAGLYGMNFDVMPELRYRYGYFVLLGVMAVIFIGALVFFKKKRWL